MLLTIAVPTYNRSETVAGTLRHLIADPASHDVEILVIDDGSTDDTTSNLTSDPDIAARVRVLTNPVNLGYPSTFARIFTECATEYVMVLADDDTIIPESLAPLIEYLGHEHPAFVSPEFLRGSTVYRGRSTTQPIAPQDFLTASAHASGLVYRVSDSLDALPLLEKRIDTSRADALTYPQVVILISLLLAARKCVWLALPTAREGSAQPSGILDADGHAYWSVESRWRQLKAFDNLLTDLARQDTTGTADVMLTAQRERAFHAITSAMRTESPDLGTAFDIGARKHYQAPPRGLLGKIKRRLYRIIHS